MLNVSSENTGFYLKNRHVFYIFNVPHIVKALRNMLMKYNLLIGEKIIS